MIITRRLFLGGLAATAAATVVSAQMIVPKPELILPATPEIIRDWLPADGRSIAIANYPELFAVVGYTFTDGRISGPPYGSSVDLPDLRPRDYFSLPGFGAGRIDDLSEDERAELRQAGHDFFIATREVTLPSGLIVPCGTLMPRERYS